MGINHSIKILNLANTFSKASLKLTKIAKSESSDEKALSFIPAIFCAKHASELYIKSILEQFSINEFSHDQSKLIKKCFLLLRNKQHIKNYETRLNDFQKRILAYHKNIIAGVKIIKGKDKSNLYFRYILDEDTSWSKELYKINITSFEEEVKKFNRDGKFLHMLSQIN